jgi:predicted small secreted protein
MKKIVLFYLVAALVMTSLTGCESLKRTGKDISSEFGGLNRTVEVYSQDGKLIKTYDGNLDIKTNEYGNKVLFDLNGKRVIINNAIVVTEEK